MAELAPTLTGLVALLVANGHRDSQEGPGESPGPKGKNGPLSSSPPALCPRRCYDRGPGLSTFCWPRVPVPTQRLVMVSSDLSPLMEGIGAIQSKTSREGFGRLGSLPHISQRTSPLQTTPVRDPKGHLNPSPAHFPPCQPQKASGREFLVEDDQNHRHRAVVVHWPL